MNKLFLPLVLLVFESFLNALGFFSWSLLDGPLALVVMFTFSHSLDMRHFLFYAAWCGLCRDLFGLDVFGVMTLSYIAIAFLIALATRFINRQNGFFVFPMVLVAAWLHPSLAVWVKTFFAEMAAAPFSGWFFIRCFIQAVGTTVLAIPLYFFSRSCGWELTES